MSYGQDMHRFIDGLLTCYLVLCRLLTNRRDHALKDIPLNAKWLLRWKTILQQESNKKKSVFISLVLYLYSGSLHCFSSCVKSTG
jgi:hypothetical protein